MQGTIKAYDEMTRTGSILDDRRNEYAFDHESFRHMGIRMFRFGQRVRFEVEGDGRRMRVRDLTILTMESQP